MIFQPNEAVDCYKLEELGEDIELGRLCAFVSKITHAKPDQDILETWKKHFTSKGVPWIVTLTEGTPPNFVLWKKDERLTPAQIQAEWANPNVNWFMDGK